MKRYTILLLIANIALLCICYNKSHVINDIEEKIQITKETPEKNSAVITSDMSCNAEEILNAINKNSSSINLKDLQTDGAVPCNPAYKATQGQNLNCYFVKMSFISNFEDGKVFVENYTKNCFFIFNTINMNVINYPYSYWEISGYSIKNGENL